MVLLNQSKAQLSPVFRRIAPLIGAFLLLAAPSLVFQNLTAQELPNSSRAPKDKPEPTSKQENDKWRAFKASPYSSDALRSALPELGKTADDSFKEWYVSGVYTAVRATQQPLYVVQIYNGHKQAIRLGLVAVISNDGRLIHALRDVRVYDGFFTEEEKKGIMDQERIGELCDLNADGYSDIPTERWDYNLERTSPTGATLQIYDTKQEMLKLYFEIQFPTNSMRRAFSPEVRYDAFHLTRDPESATGLAVKGRLVAPPSEEERKRLSDRYKDSFGRAPRIVTRVVESQPFRVMATFSWSEQAGTWVGPPLGPPDTWKVIPLSGDTIKN